MRKAKTFRKTVAGSVGRDSDTEDQDRAEAIGLVKHRKEFSSSPKTSFTDGNKTRWTPRNC